MGDVIDWIIARGREPSTWAGLAGLAAAVGISEESWSAISSAIAAVFGAVAIVVRERVQ